MSNPIIYGFNETDGMMLEEEYKEPIPLEIPHTCEHCKFWDGISRHTLYGQCNNPKVCVVCSGEGKVYYPDTYGCIFWESK